MKAKDSLGITLFLLIFNAFPNLCYSQAKQESPPWIKPTIENTHSILSQDKRILDWDFSVILADKRQDFIGYIGNDYYKVDICFDTVKKESDTNYLIKGSSKVRTNRCTFSGSVEIIDVREVNEYEYGVDDCMKGKLKKQGVCIARYRLEENRKQKYSGAFSGISLFRWYIDNNDQLHYDDVTENSDSYSNNQFAGVWQSYATGKEKKCAWGQYRIPDSGDLDIGAAEFSVNPTYLNNGWNIETNNPKSSEHTHY